MENDIFGWTQLEERWHAISVVEITIKRVMRLLNLTRSGI